MPQNNFLGNEETLVEIPAVMFLTEHLNYESKMGNELIPETGERDFFSEVLLKRRLSYYLKKLNPDFTEDSVYSAIKQITDFQEITLFEKNEKAYHLIVDQHGTVKQDGKNLTIKYIDFEHPEENEFLAVRQFRVDGIRKTCYPDIVIFINGIPVVVIECKSPFKEVYSEDIGGKVDAFYQLQRYMDVRDPNIQEGIPRLFYTNFFMCIFNKFAAYAGTISSKIEHFVEWKDPYPISVKEMDDIKNNAQNLMIQGMLEKENLLSLMENFILSEDDGTTRIKKVCRYQQFRAVSKIMTRLRAGKNPLERGGVIWHTQGSGKSLTMVMLSKILRRSTDFRDYMILVVTDRIDLDDQIYKTFSGCYPKDMWSLGSNLEKTLTQASSVSELKKLLEAGQPKIIMTTIHKFQTGEEEENVFEDQDEFAELEVLHCDKKMKVLNPSYKIIVMTDEAHRSQYSNIASNMRDALPNATFLAFTGTPIDKTQISTYRTFGSKIDEYKLTEAVADHATVAIVYEARRQDLHLLKEGLESDFDETFADKTEEEKELIKKKFATRKALAEADERIEAIVKDMLYHYKENILINGFKAQIVCVSREACVKYFDYVNQYAEEIIGQKIRAEIIFSAGNNDDVKLKAHQKTKREQDAIIKDYKKPIKDSNLCFLIVKDMLLTGFDAPIEQVMYLDRSLREHSLLQAIARVNRTYAKEVGIIDDLGNPMIQKKEFGFVVDYYGVTNNLTDALRIFDSSDFAIEDQMKSIKDLQKLLADNRKRMFDLFAGVDKKNLDALMNHLEPQNKRAEFEIAFRKYATVVEALMPNFVSKQDLDDLKWASYVRAAAKARFDPTNPLDIGDCGEKVRKLISDHLKMNHIYSWIQPITLFEDDLKEKLQSLGNGKAQASAMEHIMKRTISIRWGDSNPIRCQTLLERLQTIIEETKDNWEERKRRFEEFIQREINEGEESDIANLGYHTTGELAVYETIKKAYDEDVEGIVDVDDMKSITDDVIGIIRENMVVGFKENQAKQIDMTSNLTNYMLMNHLNTFEMDRIDRLVSYFIQLAKNNDFKK